MRRIAVIFSFVPLAAFAQNAQTPAPSQAGYGANAAARAASAAATNPQPDVAQTAGVLMQHNGGSLLRASLAAQPDPAQAKLESVSYFSVPAPEPRVLK